MPAHPERNRLKDPGKRGHYVMMVKDNHKTLHRKLKVFFDGPCLFDAQLHPSVTREGAHGRLEVRALHSSDDLPAGYTGFKDVQQIFRICRRVVSKRTSE